MSVNLDNGLVDVFQRRPGQFDLTAGFRGDGLGPLGKPDNVALLQDRVPTELLGQAFQQHPDSTGPFIGKGRQGVFVETEFFVLGADAPLGFGLGPGFQEACELIHRFDWRCQIIENSHSETLPD